MRTLEEMETDLKQIEENLGTIARIASLARPYTSYDLSTWDVLIPSTFERIKNLEKNLNEAASSIGGYARSVAIDLRFGKRRMIDAQTEFCRASEIGQTLMKLAKALENQAARFDAYQEQVVNRLGGS